MTLCFVRHPDRMQGGAAALHTQTSVGFVLTANH